MKGKGAVVCEEVVDKASGETRFKILVSRKRTTAVELLSGIPGTSKYVMGRRVSRYTHDVLPVMYT